MNHHVLNGLIGASAVLVVGGRLVPGSDQSGPVLKAATAFVAPKDSALPRSTSAVASRTNEALQVLGAAVHELSHPKALAAAFGSYFAFKAANPDAVTKPYLYYVDYGLPSTEARGWVFDMEELRVVDGPFMVAHGRGSSRSQYGVPTRFSNSSGSNATSLGLYLTGSTYAFHGKSAGHSYSSVGLRLLGQSDRFNSNAFARGVVAHGAPYVGRDKAGRSEGCPAMEPQRAQRLLPKLADGGLVFLFAPDSNWMSRDPWIGASLE